MNIFVLDLDPERAAQMLCDKHSSKMVLESCQLLSAAHRILDGDSYADEVGLYKVSHRNHPCSVWTRSSSENYLWLHRHFTALCREFYFRRGKSHKSSLLAGALARIPDTIPLGPITPFAQAMPDEYKNDDPVQAYRAYYLGAKADFAAWTWGRPAPSWWQPETTLTQA
jgi:hypothetical protein